MVLHFRSFLFAIVFDYRCFLLLLLGMIVSSAVVSTLFHPIVLVAEAGMDLTATIGTAALDG